MPYTKRKAHHGDISNLIEYILDEEKTDGGILVSGLNCQPYTAATEFKNTATQFHSKGSRTGYHLVQSFSPLDNITPEQVHEIGVKLAKELYPNFQVVVATHIDKGHLHNHIAINSVNLEGSKLNDKLNDEKEGLYAYKNKSDEIAAVYGCYIMPKFEFEPKKQKGDMYYYYKHQTWRNNIIEDMKQLKLECSSMNEFIVKLFELGYDVKYGKYISVKPQGKERFVRLKTLSEEFSEDNLRLFFSGKQPNYHYRFKHYDETEFNTKYVEYYEELILALKLTSSVAMKNGSYPAFQKTKRKSEYQAEQLQTILDTLTKEKIFSFDDLENKIKNCRRQIKILNFEKRKYEKENQDLLDRISKAQDFISLKREYDYAMYYKSIDEKYEIPKEIEMFEMLAKELSISTVDEAKEIIKSASAVRKEINTTKSEIYDIEQKMYQYELIKEEELLKSDMFIHNIKVGNNRIDYENSTETQWCINLPYCDYYIMIDKSLTTFNHKYGYNTLFLIDDKKYSLMQKSENTGLQRVNSLNGKQLDNFVKQLKLENIEKHKEKAKE